MIKEQKLTASCYIISSDKASVMFGCPSDIIKVLNAKHIKCPENIILPDSFFQYGLNIAATEFPVANFLYGQSASKTKMNIIGGKDAIERQKIILGETFPFLRHVKRPLWTKDARTYKYLTYEKFIRSKKPIKSDINFIAVSEGENFFIGDICVQKTGKNKFKAISLNQEINIDLTLDCPPIPYFQIPTLKPLPHMKTGIVVIGVGNGFSPYEENSSLIVFSDYIPIAIDGSANQRNCLEALGISAQSIPIFVLTHNHDDHSCILDLIFSGKSIHLLTTRQIYESFIRKSAAILNVKPSVCKKSVKFTELIPDKTVKLYNTTFKAHETIHSIPCIGIRIGEKILISGDTVWGTTLLEMRRQGIISESEYRRIDAIPKDSKAQFIFMDAGGAPVHPQIEELSGLSAQYKAKLILNHISLNKIPKDENFIPGLLGQTLVIESGYKPISIENASDIFSNFLFDKLGKTWEKICLAESVLRKYSRLQRIDLSSKIGIIANGTIEDKHGRTLGIGDIAGLLGSEAYRAISETSLLLINRRLILECLRHEHLLETFEHAAKAERAISEMPILRRLTQTQIFKNRKAIKFLTAAKGEVVPFQNQIIKSTSLCKSDRGQTILPNSVIYIKNAKLTFENEAKIVSINFDGFKKTIPSVLTKKILEGEIL